ncbi:MAG TPA: sialate O-acetylesterase [Pirellulaceae bacterium]|nr:sialate O-acetylesterase [Pirellulaceae bacterium]
MKSSRSSFFSRFTTLALFLSLALLLAAPASADVRLPAIFADHMVLQQGIECRVWGWADPGEEVTVSIDGVKHTASAGKDGRWQTRLQALSVTRPGESLTLTVQGKNTIEIQDVLVGEVWICSGQSNMAWAVSQANDADLETKTARFSRIRLISVPQVGTQEPQDDFKGKWEVCTPEAAAQFSAVGYFFGRQLHQTLDVPVGLIDNAWGGSACEAWVRRDILEGDAKYAALMQRWTQTEKSFDADKEQAAFQTKLQEWRDLAAKARAEGKQPPPQPRFNNPLVGNARPANIYNGVLKPTIGYGIRGVIWYQGESNAPRAYQYRDLFPLMIQSWRDEWQQGDFPFYFVQLADFKEEKPEPAESDWAELREAQTMTMARLPNTGQAVIIDIGEGKDIHPKNKQDVAMRLARWALARDYGPSDLVYRSPEYKSMEKQGSKIVVTLDHVGGGLAPFDTGEPVGFAIAGEDKKFVWAKAKLVGTDKVEVWSDAVAEPVAVRYAWADNPVCNLYSKEGLPVTPFRTDDWPGVTAEAK